MCITIIGQKVSVYVTLSILLLLVAASLRFHDLSQRSMWIDEAVAAINSQGSIAEMIDNTRSRNTSPIIYPLILHAIQKIDRSAESVRFPSAVFSLLAVLVILALPTAGIDRRAAFIAATVLTLSSSQIHWAQQTREYSLSVLLAALMIYGLLTFLNSEGRKHTILYASLFIAPLIQYGLVLFAFAVIGTLGFAGLLRRKQFIGDIVKPSIALALGGIISLILTLRYQWQANANIHLHEYFFQGNLFDLKSLVIFLAAKTYSLLKYLMLGEMLLGVFLVALTFFACQITRSSKMDQQSFYTLPLFLLAIVISIVAVLADAYPYGAAHQCIYLAPATALVFGCASITTADSLKGGVQAAWTGMVILVVLISGAMTLQNRNPYREIEDIKSVLSYLEDSQNNNIPVYVYPGAEPALTFYGISGNRFYFGEHYPQVDEKSYREELNAAMALGTGQLWIILSSVVPEVENLIVAEIPADWHIEKKVDATKAALFLAHRPGKLNKQPANH
jgi:hypothetical protein